MSESKTKNPKCINGKPGCNCIEEGRKIEDYLRGRKVTPKSMAEAIRNSGDADMSVHVLTPDNVKGVMQSMVDHYVEQDRAEICAKLMEVAETVYKPDGEASKEAVKNGMHPDTPKEIYLAVRALVTMFGLAVMGKPMPEVNVASGSVEELEAILNPAGREGGH
jgi:hypothetical protein